jgi:hypothetical protein
MRELLDLHWDVFVTPGIPTVTRDLPPGTTRQMWQPMWIAALDIIESLTPCAVIDGHRRPENDDSPTILAETRRYIRDFDRVAETTTSARALRHDA